MSDDRSRRQEESLAAIEAGGIPLAAQERLDSLRDRTDGFFTSDLSVAEFALIREAGFRPVTQVMGTCFFQMGWSGRSGGPGASLWGTGWVGGSGSAFELEQQTEAWNEARGRALARLSEEATRAGADAVVGVHLKRGRYDWAAGLVEFVAVGTAVRSERYDLGGEPTLSNLSGQEFATLFAHGFWPVGLVAGSTVVYVASGYQQQRSSAGLFGMGGWTNQELPDFTRGVSAARELAMERVTRQAHAAHAHGIVGVQFDRRQSERERDANNMHYTDLIVEIHVVGTAVVELDRSTDPTEYIALSLNDQETG
jgi:uncharacterized protein YbjQ (UPF0145 family)